MTNNTSIQDLDEFTRQKKQAEMIRQYLQITNIDRTNALPKKYSTSDFESYHSPNTTKTILPLSSLNFNELRHDVKMAEERVERLREELKEIQRKRDDSFIKTPLQPPPSYASSLVNNINSEFLTHNRSTSMNRRISNRSSPPLVQERLPLQQLQNQRQMLNTTMSSPNFNSVNHSPLMPGGVSATFADLSNDHRQRQFFSTMRQHREQLVVYLDSLKQALDSLERLVSLEPTRSEVHLTNTKLDTIQQKSRQLRALKSNRSSQQSPFIECRIRQLEHDLVYMLSEHQKDVQTKLELNEQRSLMLLKIMQVTDELASVDQQIQQLSYNNTDVQRINSSSSSNEIHQQQPLRVINSPNNLDERHISFRDSTDNNNNNPLSKLTNIYYHHHHHH